MTAPDTNRKAGGSEPRPNETYEGKYPHFWDRYLRTCYLLCKYEDRLKAFMSEKEISAWKSSWPEGEFESRYSKYKVRRASQGDAEAQKIAGAIDGSE